VSRAYRKLAAQERLAVAQEWLVAAQEFEQEQQIMSIHIDKVVSWQRDYYLKLQQKIMQKHAGGSGPSNMSMPCVCVIKWGIMLLYLSFGCWFETIWDL
jgi:hypothetical protein